MNTTLNAHLVQRFQTLQYEFLPFVREELALSPKLEKVICAIEWSNIESEVYFYRGACVGRPPADRCALACAFLAKSILGIVTTEGLIERLQMDSALKRICGFSMHKKIPDRSTFSRAFTDFAKTELMTRVHEAMIKFNLGDQVIGHGSRDSTMITARERVVKSPDVEPEVNPPARKRGRPAKNAPKVESVKSPSPVAVQLKQSLSEMLKDLPQYCAIGTKVNAKGFKETTKGYKLHLDTACCGVVLSAYLTGAGVHDSRLAIPLSLITAQRVQVLYETMDAAYCSEDIREFIRSQGRVPLIDHNKRGGEKKEFCKAEAERYKVRSGAERSNARLKDEFGGRVIYYRGHEKIMSHLMFGLVAQTVDQLMRLII